MVIMSGTALLFVLIPALGTLVSCARVSTERAFSQVGNEVRERTGYRVHWDQGSRPDGEVTQAIRRLLAEPLTPEAAAQIALLNNRHLHALYEGLGVAQAAVVDAGLLSNPIFHGSATFPVARQDSSDGAPDLTYCTDRRHG